MHLIKIDLVSFDPKDDEYVLYLVEDGPWPSDPKLLDSRLSDIQNRIFDAIDFSAGGYLAQKYNDSLWKKVRIQIDSPRGVPPEVIVLIDCIRSYIDDDNDHARMIKTSKYISGLRIITGHELGRFGGKDNSKN